MKTHSDIFVPSPVLTVELDEAQDVIATPQNKPPVQKQLGRC